jgi:glycosyltransferase involved in cell wall biosynthesis
MSRIAIDIRPLLDRQLTGVGFALLEALREILPHASPTREYILFATGTRETLERLPPLPQNAHVRIVTRRIPNKLAMMYSLLRPDALDILVGEVFDAWWFPNWTIIATKKPYALTVHDASFTHTPHFYPWKNRLLIKLARPNAAAKRARYCITVSPHTAEDIQFLWGISPSRIHVAPLGVDHTTFSIREQASDRSYRAGYDLNRPYILSLATHEARKNIVGLIEGYQAARMKLPSLPPLVLAGTRRHSLPEELLSHVHVLGYVPAKHRPALLRGAQALLFPSFNEGFGLPVLEALACGTPVITSVATPPSSLFRTGVFPVDPYNVHDIARALMEAISSPHDISQKQRLQDQTLPFTWKSHAQVLLHVFQRLS